MSTCTLYHKRDCTKSRTALDCLLYRKIDVRIVEYITSPPSVALVKSICKALDQKPWQIVRYACPIAKSLNLEEKAKLESDDYFYRLISEIPLLMQRPILVKGNKAAIGRPLDNITALFEENTAYA